MEAVGWLLCNSSIQALAKIASPIKAVCITRNLNILQKYRLFAINYGLTRKMYDYLL